jgi:hypothetical protein
MDSKSEFLLKRTEELVNKSSVFQVDLIVCGGLAIHILSDFLGRKSPRPWNHKDIDFIVPLSQFSKTIAFFKSLGYVKIFVPYKKSHLLKNHIRFGNQIDDFKVLVDVYGQPKVVVVKVKHGGFDFPIVSPRIELENWVDRKRRLGSKPSIDLSIEFLKLAVTKNLPEEVLV